MQSFLSLEILFLTLITPSYPVDYVLHSNIWLLLGTHRDSLRNCSNKDESVM